MLICTFHGSKYNIYVYEKQNNSIGSSYINNDSNNNNKSVNIFYELYSIWVDVFARFLLYGSPGTFCTSTRRWQFLSFSLCLSFSRCIRLRTWIPKMHSLLQFYGALFVLCSLSCFICVIIISITDLFFNWLSYLFFTCSLSLFLCLTHTVPYFFPFACLFGMQNAPVLYPYEFAFHSILFFVVIVCCMLASAQPVLSSACSFIRSILCILKWN